MTIRIAYRATVYAPRSEDPTEATVLTPASGADHSDNFKVCTMDGIAGFRGGALAPVVIREGKLDPLTCHSDVGEAVLTLYDERTGTTGSELIRWITAFVGDDQGVHRLSGCKVIIERSTDAGVTWVTCFTGRIRGVTLNGLIPYELVVQDMSRELSARCFVGRPHSSITYAGMMSLCPIGPTVAHGQIPAIAPLTGAMARWNSTQAGAAVYHAVALDVASQRAARNLYTDDMYRALGRDRIDYTNYPNFETSRLRCRLTRLDTSATGVFVIGAFTSYIEPGPVVENRAVRVATFAIAPLDTSDPDYLALPPDATAVEAHIFLDDVVSDNNPLLIGDVHPAQLKKDLLDGLFSPVYRSQQTLPTGLAIGDAVFSFGHQDADDASGRSGFTDFIADLTLPTVRFVITKPWQLWQFIEEQLDRPFRQGLRTQPDGKAIPMDLRMPTSLPALTITDSDLAKAAVGWKQDPEGAIWGVQATRYGEFPSIEEVATGNVSGGYRIDRTVRFPATVAEFIEGGAVNVTVIDLGSLDAGEQSLKLDCQGLRSQPGETINGISRAAWCDRIIETFAQQLRAPFGRGPATIVLECDDTANTTDCQKGDKRLIAVRAVPDPSSHRRGGTRVGLCIDRQVRKSVIVLAFLDLGVNVVATAPTVGTPTANATDPHHAVDTGVTVNASGEQAVLHIASTATSVGTRPADDSALWTLAGRATATGTVVTRRLPSNMRHWVRVRTEAMPQAGLPPKLPSAWAYPSGTGYVATTAYTAPSITSINPDGRFAEFVFAPGNVNLPTAIYLHKPESDPAELLWMLPPGSVDGRIDGLELSTEYRLTILHPDGVGGASASDTDTFTTDAGAAAGPGPGTMTLLVGAL